MRYPLRTACLALGAAILVSGLRAQVVLSEVEFTSRNKEGQWIELYNMGQKSVDLSGWSLGMEKRGSAGNKQFFFGFPKNTVVGAGKFVRVHWMAKVQSNQVCPGKNGLEVYTGDTVYHFLFGLGAEPLAAPAGALGLFDTQKSSDMAKKEHVQDWVQWGSTDWLREGLAIAAKQWVTGTFAPAVDTQSNPVPTLAYDYRTPTVPTSGFVNWYLDKNPTPCQDNTGGGSFLTTYGSSCKGTLPVSPSFQANGIPKRGVGGGTDFEKFKLILSPAASSQSEFGVWFFAAKKAQLPLTGNLSACSLYVDLGTLNIIPMIPAGNQAEIRFDKIPTQALPGVYLANQAAVLSPKGVSLSNGLEYRFGQ